MLCIVKFAQFMPKQECFGSCSNESQGGTEGRPGDILISAVCLHACQVYSWMKDVSPCWARTRYTEVNKSLIKHSLWTDWRVCVLFLSTEAQKGELQRLHQEAQGWSKPSDFMVPLDERHVHLPTRIYSCHRFTANKAPLCSMLHYKDMDVQYFSLEEDRVRGTKGNP